MPSQRGQEPAPSAGERLGAAERAAFELWFGQDLGAVRVQADAGSAQAAARLNAAAFSSGQHISFGAGSSPSAAGGGGKLLAHELTHVLQTRGSSGAPSRELSDCGDASEREAESVAAAFAAGRTAPALRAAPHARIARQEDDPDHPTVPSPPAAAKDVTLEPLDDWTPLIDTFDPATFWTPPGTSREQVAQRLYGDPDHVGGFDVIGEKHVRLRTLDGVAADVVTSVRAALDPRLRTDVDAVVGLLKQRLINDAAEWQLLKITVDWAGRGDLTDATKRSYFDAYLDLLDSHQLEEWGLPSNTKKPASQWLVTEAEEKKWAILPLLGRRSARPGPAYPAGSQPSDFGKVTGPITAAPTPYQEVPKAVGGYSYFSGENRTGISSEKHNIGSIQVGELILDESTATRAETALRNSPRTGPRVMIPGGNGRFYGYTIASPGFWNEGYVSSGRPEDARLERFWWHYPGTVFIPGGSFQPEFGKGTAAEASQRAEILTKGLAAGITSLRGLDFDVLSLLTLDQRVTVLGLAIGTGNSGDASLVARVLYSTPAEQFAVLEHRLSGNGTMTRLINMQAESGALAMIGRIFTVKAIASMQVPGENLQSLPEFKFGFDADGFYHWAVRKTATAGSRLLPPADFPVGGAVRLGQERAAPGEAAGPITRTVANIQPMIFRLGSSGLTGMAANMYRAMMKELIVNDGAEQGPYLPTQLVRVTSIGANPQSRIVSLVEAVGLLDLPDQEILNRMIKTQMQGGTWLMAATGLSTAFGPALARGLASGGGATAIGEGVAAAAGTAVGRAAIVNSVLIGAMALVDEHRSALEKTAEGRAFLALFDVTMTIWIAHDLARLITSGLIPKLVSAADRVMALPGVLRDAVMPLRAEAEALRRAIARYGTEAEALAAVTREGAMMAAGRETGPGFFAMLRVSRGEVAAEQLLGKLAGTTSEAMGKRVLDRLRSLVSRSEGEAAAAAGKTADTAEAKAATRRAESAADARFAIAQRASQLRPEARAAFLQAVEKVVAARPNSLASLTDLLIAAAQSRLPNSLILEVQTLVNRPGVSDEALLVLGRKAREGLETLDLRWLNRTSITDSSLDFLGRDRRTPWDLYRRAATDPAAKGVMKAFRTAARGAGAEMVAEPVAQSIGTNVRRQVKMGKSEIDFDMVVAGKRHGFEVKGWGADTWADALEAVIQRLNKKGLTEAQKEAVEKIDTMLTQLQNAKAATGQVPYLGFTDALPAEAQARLRRILDANGLPGTRFVPLSEAAIKEAAAGTIGAPLGVPRP
ncbi:DUF4157 domain-containing protein [Paenarthrobacter sp. PH39-S1]|uniref:eCIS core domain-containing protein n=1 Tax=Paenarthrobacter sp. PH39-S1 TaxID=3046204 RepID=UPI0024BA2469|nr:DUF4157 domain-containing protein [Paenarthrobacter sp. PH39-S1]MDJ0355292.1 DUF4157 domain-containing protein [Paenarthrobacter sp. PH39-S1]